MNKENGHTGKLGMFVIIGLLLFVVTIYFIGKQKNLFGDTLHLKSQFKNVSGLKIGNNVRFSGINIGTIDEIELLTDTSVIVGFIIKKEIQQFIKTNATTSISSDGLMGDKVLMISPGSFNGNVVKANEIIKSKKSIEMEDIMNSIKTTTDNAGIISAQLAQFSFKMNNGKGALSILIGDEEFSSSLKSTLVNLEKSSGEFAEFTTKMNNGKSALSKLVSDEKFGNKLDSTMSNLQSGTKELNETIEAAQHNFLLKGFFKNKKKVEAKKLTEIKKSAKKRAEDSLKAVN